MGKLKILLEEAQKGKDIQESQYGRFPFEIASGCGPEEVKDIITGLDELFLRKERIEDWDGDSQDDIWYAQRDFSGLLQRLTNKYPNEISQGLKSHYPETRFWVACAFEKAPSVEAISSLAEYLLNEMPEHHRKVGVAAFKACKKQKNFFKRLFGKNA